MIIISAMTLKLRNRWIQSFFLFSLCCILLALSCFVYSLIKKTILPPPLNVVKGFFSGKGLLGQNFTATLCSLALVVLYVPLTLFLLYKSFEKTHAIEVLYFVIFLAGCLCEVVRLLIICFGLWQTFSDVLILLGRIILFGRISAPLSFVFASLMSDNEHRQNAERNLLMLLIVSAVLAIAMPLNTARIAPTGFVTIGFSNMFIMFRLLLIVISYLSFLMKAEKDASVEYKRAAMAFLLLIAGYSVLTASDNFIFMTLGMGGLSAGTFQYLYNIHKHYWDY